MFSSPENKHYLNEIRVLLVGVTIEEENAERQGKVSLYCRTFKRISMSRTVNNANNMR
jgi:hypothetical protein